MEAQRKAVTQFAGNELLEVVGEFIEVETGKGADALERRPNLAGANAALGAWLMLDSRFTCLVSLANNPNHLSAIRLVIFLQCGATSYPVANR